MKFDREVLQIAAEKGSAKVAEAFSTLAKCQVETAVSEIKTVPLIEAIDLIQPESNDRAIVVYGQMLAGIKGISLLVMSRESALTLVDLLNQQSVGTTGILKDIDRSAIKETLNILSNSYMTALSESAGIELGLGVPTMVSQSRLQDVIRQTLEKGDAEKDDAVIFALKLKSQKYDIETNLYILFRKEFLEIVEG
jgi:chemotaxis protein CheY-P-specific phosphatase CheC